MKRKIIWAVTIVIILLYGVAFVFTRRTSDEKSIVITIGPGQLDDPNIVARDLAQLWLEQFKGSLNISQRLTDYSIHNIRVTQQNATSFNVGVSYSVKPLLLDITDWVAGNGIPNSITGWVDKKYMFIIIERHDHSYSIQSVGSGP